MAETITVDIPAQAGSEAPGEQTQDADPGHGGRIIAALESAWAAMKAHHPDIPEVVMITGTSRQLGGQRWGHFGPELWALPEEGIRRRASELFIAGELIAKGGRAVMEVLLHEAGHGVAHTRKIKDTSGDGNRYHNQRFVKIVEELGLKKPASPVKTHGWSFCTITDETAARYADVIAELDAAGLPYLGAMWDAPVGGDDDQEEGNNDGPAGGDEDKPKKKRRGGKRFAVACGCDQPRRLQITPKSLEDGPIICGVCREDFTPEETPDGPRDRAD
ncbi:hypothetical protein ABTY59_33610 [Streptomyces sp. NPDC096079]|uniref:hypothetical protein n=1 Tax=Streptomyces sp. NPDC096079 TaxID=3155820 RepID=UPI0033167492